MIKMPWQTTALPKPVSLPPEQAIEKKMDKGVPHGLAKKPGGMPPGQYKKAVNSLYLELSQPSQQLYIDPEGVVRSTQHALNMQQIKHDIKNSTKEYNRNMALTAKGYHPAKVPHPLFTHFINR